MSKDIAASIAAGVKALAYSPDDDLFASASSDAAIKTWNAQNGTLVKTLTGHVRPINAFGLYAGEARKFGIPLIYVARGQKHDLPKDMVREIGHVTELIDSLI